MEYMKVNRRNIGRYARIAALLMVGIFLGSALTAYAYERQPHMRAALVSLTRAAGQLNAAQHDKQGHRAAALNLVEQAISQVRIGIASDRRGR